MAIRDPKAPLSSSSRRILDILRKGLSVRQVSDRTGQSIDRVRDNINEMIVNGLVTEQEGRYKTTGPGLEKLK